MSFFGLPNLDVSSTSVADFAHNQQCGIIEPNPRDFDAYSGVAGNGGDVIWVALHSYSVEGQQFHAVIFCDDNYDEYQVGITTDQDEAQREYNAVVRALAGQSVVFTTTDVDARALHVAKTLTVRPSFLEV